MENDLVLQILEWDNYTEDDDDGNGIFTVRLFGKTKENKSVYLKVEGYSPYFYIEIDRKWKDSTAIEILNSVKSKVYPKEFANGLKGYKFEEKYKLYEFTNFTKFRFMKLNFKNFESMKAYAWAFSKKIKLPYSQKMVKIGVYESNIHPILRLMHIRELNSVGWINIPRGDYSILNNNFATTTCDINAVCHWTKINKVDDNSIQNFTIAAFDIECTSEDGSFPNPLRDGDKVIQIGVTMSRFGEDECYYKHIITLKKTSKIEGATVEYYETEEEVLLAFSNLIRKLDPDVITGWNIFGFDFEYLMKRSKKLGIMPKFSRLSRVKGEISEFIVQELSSSGMGDNILKYYKMTGRVVIDLYKVVQSLPQKLPSYKLDEVASFFIRETVTEFIVDVDKKTTLIKTRNTDGVYVDQYIKICFNDGITENKHMDGEKFKILKLESNSILVKGIIETDEIINKNYKIFWCQAKDDVKPQEIFSLQEGTANDRAIIAKYCIQDCALCNKLMSKLQILTNNIGMANVCNVPLSYIFLRGQGVKIFSLVAKICRQENHLIKLVRKKQKPTENPENINSKYANQNDDEEYDEDDDEGYEGATVFPPKKGAHYQGTTVLDFASLYPNAMIMRNLSHEMLVKDQKYLNLPGYRYHVIEYKVLITDEETDDSDMGNRNYGMNKIKKNDKEVVENYKTVTCIFAEKLNGERGIIAKILINLLSARKHYRTLAENTKDPFLRSVLDGLQLAFKVTANSLYGQTGAPTSPIYMKEIAASTTATGREMLCFSKYFVENMYAEMINLAIAGDKEKYMEYMEKIYMTYPHKILLPDGNKICVHTDPIFIIPDNKFVRGQIGYSVKNDVSNKFKLNIKTKKNSCKTILLDDVFFKTLSSIDYCKRKQFTETMKDYMLKPSTLFYSQNSEVIDKLNMCESDVDFDDFIVIESINKTDDPILFLKKIELIVDNMGYTTKIDMFHKFYDTVRGFLSGYTIKPEIIYGDTDSVFFISHIKNMETGEILKNKLGLEKSIMLGIWGSIMITTLLPPPMAQEYEKVLWPFIILTKKRYVGNLYEKDSNKFYQKSMGIVLKRRDNAPIVKVVCGGIVDQMLNKQNPKGAVELTKETLKKIITGKYPLDKYIITKTLRSTYSGTLKQDKQVGTVKIRAGEKGRWNWDELNCSLAHVTLCQRMTERDPGNKPSPNDRIPYVYFETTHKTVLQGDKIEHPDYLTKNKLKIDYLFYITNQISKPAIQFLELIVENPEQIFKEYIIREENRKKGVAPIVSYFNTDGKVSFDDFSSSIPKMETIATGKTKRVFKKRQ